MSQIVLGQIVEKIGLVFISIEGAEELPAIGDFVILHPRIVSCCDQVNAAFSLSPINHRTKFHGLIAIGAGQWRDALTVTIDQILNNVFLKDFAAIHHMMRDAHLFTELRSINHAF